jgi:hypothetical protein
MEDECVEFGVTDDPVKGKKFATNVTGPGGSYVIGAPRITRQGMQLPMGAGVGMGQPPLMQQQQGGGGMSGGPGGPGARGGLQANYAPNYGQGGGGQSGQQVNDYAMQ